MDDRYSDDHVSTIETARDVGRLVVIGVAIAAGVVLVLLALDNRQDVRVGYLFGELTAPLWTVVVLAAAAGLILGWLIRHRRRRD